MKVYLLWGYFHCWQDDELLSVYSTRSKAEVAKAEQEELMAPDINRFEGFYIQEVEVE